MAEYRPGATSAHGLEEEMQWARILSTGRPAPGMALLYVQKLCTAFHEFDPAWRQGALDERHVDFFRDRLAARMRRVLVTLENNGLDKIHGAADMAVLLGAVESAGTMEELAGLAERVHAVNHVLCDSLEALP